MLSAFLDNFMGGFVGSAYRGDIFVVVFMLVVFIEVSSVMCMLVIRIFMLVVMAMLEDGLGSGGCEIFPSSIRDYSCVLRTYESNRL
jgi:hypothetical protein